MIPQNFKDIISNAQYAGLFQTIAMILFILVFLGIIWFVFSKPKKYYSEEESAPLNEDEDLDAPNQDDEKEKHSVK